MILVIKEVLYLTILQILSALLPLVVCFTCFFFYKFYLLPKFGMEFYKKQGLQTFYYPILGPFKKHSDDLKKHGDYFYTHKMMARKEQPKVLCSNVGPQVLLFLNDTEIIKEFYHNQDCYIKDPSYSELTIMVMGEGLIFSEGQKWKKQRKILSNSFHFEFLKSMLPTVQSTIHTGLNEMYEASIKTKGQKIDLLLKMQQIAGEVVGKIFFGQQLHDYLLNGKPLISELSELITEVGTMNREPLKVFIGVWFIKMGILPRHKKLMNRIKSFRNMCHEIVQDRKRQRKSNDYTQKIEKDMLDVLLDLSNGEAGMSEIEIIDQFVNFFLAGMDTTSHLITIALYQLEQYPEYKAQVLKEIKQHYQVGRPTTIEGSQVG